MCENSRIRNLFSEAGGVQPGTLVRPFIIASDQESWIRTAASMAVEQGMHVDPVRGDTQDEVRKYGTAFNLLEYFRYSAALRCPSLAEGVRFRQAEELFKSLDDLVFEKYPSSLRPEVFGERGCGSVDHVKIFMAIGDEEGKSRRYGRIPMETREKLWHRLCEQRDPARVWVPPALHEIAG